MGGEPPHDNLDVEAFVHDHKRSTLRKLTKLNMYEVWEDDIDDIHIVAFADEHDPEGNFQIHFYHDGKAAGLVLRICEPVLTCNKTNLNEFSRL